MRQLDNLLEKYPGTPVYNLQHVLDPESFDFQQQKYIHNPKKGASIGVIWHGDQLVLSKRSKLHPGWALIGGTKQNDESFEECMHREAYEELGVEITIGKLVMLERKIFVLSEDKTKRLHMPLAVFEATIHDGQQPITTDVARSEGLHIECFDVNKLPDPMILADREKIEMALSARQAA